MSTCSSSCEMSDLCAFFSAILLTKENPKKYIIHTVVVLLYKYKYIYIQNSHNNKQ